MQYYIFYLYLHGFGKFFTLFWNFIIRSFFNNQFLMQFHTNELTACNEIQNKFSYLSNISVDTTNCYTTKNIFFFYTQIAMILVMFFLTRACKWFITNLYIRLFPVLPYSLYNNTQNQKPWICLPQIRLVVHSAIVWSSNGILVYIKHKLTAWKERQIVSWHEYITPKKIYITR